MKPSLPMSLLMLILIIFASFSRAETVQVSVQIPSVNTSPYHRPYLAAWVETEDRKGITSLAVWYDDSKWLNDMRQWWRKLGNHSNFDSVTGATKPPGTYQIVWTNSVLPAGDYYLCIEAAREEGGREYLRKLISLGETEPRQYFLQGKHEIARVDIKINP